MTISKPRRKGPPLSTGDLSVIEAVDRHVQKYVGEIATVLDEKRSPYVHIDVHIVAPTKARNYFTLVTSGMSELPMTAPQCPEDGRYAELMICLPPDWPMTYDSWGDESNWWPLRVLKETARYPFEADEWLYAGHSITNGNPTEPYASNTKLTATLLLKPMLLPAGAQIIEIAEEKHAIIWALFPVYEEELTFKLRYGSDALERRFVEYGITELLNPVRVNVAV